MRNFKEFIDEKIVIAPKTKEEAKSILKMCEEKGIKWKGTHKKPTDYNFEFGLSRLGIEHGLLAEGWRFNRTREIVPASDFLTQSPPTIEIFQSKQTVVCLKKRDGKVIAAGKARCNPEDVFDFEFGATLAFQRMIWMKPVEPMKPPFDISDYEQGIKTLKNGMRIKKQDVYEVGDRVLIKKKTTLTILGEMNDCLGKVCTVAQAGSNGVKLKESSPFGFRNKDIKGKVIQ